MNYKDGTRTLAASSEVSFKEEGQSECAHLLYKDSSCVGSNIGNYRQLKHEYLPYVYVCKR